VELRAQGATGKIQGTVLDPTGQPLQSAQVLVLGTGFAAVTDVDGYYFFNHVPAGMYDMRAQFLGYQPAEVQRARVLADQTLTVNFGLSGAVALEAITISAAETPIVPRDQVTSKSITAGDVLTELPVDDARSVVNLQPGVVESGSFDGVSIRGGRPGEAVVYVDGVPVRRLQYGAARLDVGTNAVEEVSVTTGALDAEYGDAQSGVISLVTRSGGPRFQATLLYETDELFGNSIRLGLNRFEGSLSGPIVGNLTFFLSGTVAGQQGGTGRPRYGGIGLGYQIGLSGWDGPGMGWDDVPTYVLGGLDTSVTVAAADNPGEVVTVGIPRFVQYGGECDPADNSGVECQGQRLPYSWRTYTRANAKLTYTYGSGSRVSLSGLWDVDQERDYPVGRIFNPGSYTGARRQAQAYILNWVQQVFRRPETELAFDLNLSYQRDSEAYSQLDGEWELNHRSPALGIDFSRMRFLIDFDHFSDGDPNDPRSVTTLLTQADWDQLVDNVRSGIGTRASYERRNDLYLRQPYRMNPFGIAGYFPTEGYSWNGARLNEDDRWIGRLNVDWQFDRYNRLKFGGEGQVGRLNATAADLIDPPYTDAYSESPVRWAAYLQDRLDLGDVVLELGLRWDYFDTRALFPVSARTYEHPVFDPDVPIEEFTCRGDQCDPDQHIWRESDSHSAWSPRLRVSFPVTDRNNIRLSYAHQVQTPAMQILYADRNWSWPDINGGNVSFARTVLFEFGARHAFTRDLVLDFAAYNKEKLSDFASRTFQVLDPVNDVDKLVSGITNADFGSIRGFEVQLLYRVGNWFSGQAAYSFQTARGTGSDPYSRWYDFEFSQVTGELTPPPEALLRLDHDRRHNITGSLAFNWPDDFQRGTWYGALLRNGGLFVRFQFLSGLPYTREINTGVGGVTFGGSGGWDRQRSLDDQLNASSLPWQYYVDLRVTKGIRLGPTDWTLYADFRNLFNIRNVLGVFEETGTVRNDLDRDIEIADELARLREEAGSSRIVTIEQGGQQLEAIDVSQCGGPVEWLSSGGAVDCVLVQRTEARFGDGDQLYDDEEQRAALIAWYDMKQGEQWYTGSPRHIRLGVELSF
jgi:outer membrane receptor protein involved in Fe transport